MADLLYKLPHGSFVALYKQNIFRAGQAKKAYFLFTIKQCGNLWPEQHFSTTYLQNNATDSVLKIVLLNLFCPLASIWLICTTQIVDLEKCLEIDQHPQTLPIFKRE